MSDDNMREVYRNLNASQDKYIYFLLTATIAAIGFTITTTNSLKLNITQIPLAVSVICWGLSFWFGCRNRQYFNSTLFANFDLIRVQNGQHPNVGAHPQLIQAASDGIKEAININSDRASKLANIQMYMFLLGAFFYIAWHILEMYLR
jgi:hypothetical protein